MYLLNKGTSTLLCNIYFSLLYLSWKFVVQTGCAFCCSVGKYNITTTETIFGFQKNYFMVNDAPLFKDKTFIIAVLWWCTIWCWSYCLVVNYFKIILCDVLLFSYCIFLMLHVALFHYRTIWCFTVFMLH